MVAFLTLLRAAGLPEPEQEYAFALPERKWRFDFAWPAEQGGVALEIDGGQWKTGGGRHNKDSDRTKLNEAAARHWIVLRFSHTMLRDEAACLDVIRRALDVSIVE